MIKALANTDFDNNEIIKITVIVMTMTMTVVILMMLTD